MKSAGPELPGPHKLHGAVAMIFAAPELPGRHRKDALRPGVAAPPWAPGPGPLGPGDVEAIEPPPKLTTF